MNERWIKIKETKTERLIASARAPEKVFLFEGAWYFDPNTVDMSNLVISDRTYICPYKGTCYWIDLVAPDYVANNVGFVYFEVFPGYEHVLGKIGLFAGHREATVQETKVCG